MKLDPFQIWLLSLVGAFVVLLTVVLVVGAFGVFAGWPVWAQLPLGLGIGLLAFGFAFLMERAARRKRVR